MSSVIKERTIMAWGPKNYFKKRFNVSQWIGSDEIKRNASMITKLLKSDKQERAKNNSKIKNMSFEEIIQTNQWSQTDIEKNKIYQVRMCYGFLAFAGVILLIAMYFFLTSNIFGGLFSLLFMLLGLAYAYQAWVSYEQLKQCKIRINIKASLLSLFNLKKNK